MNENDLYKKCPVTGFLDPLDGKGILPRHKTAFLKNYKKSANPTKSVETLGFRYSELEHQLEIDAVFREEYRLVKIAMKHELEEELYNGNSKQKELWLKANFPEEYGAKKTDTKLKKKEDPLAGLLEKL